MPLNTETAAVNPRVGIARWQVVCPFGRCERIAYMIDWFVDLSNLVSALQPRGPVVWWSVVRGRLPPTAYSLPHPGARPKPWPNLAKSGQKWPRMMVASDLTEFYESNMPTLLEISI